MSFCPTNIIYRLPGDDKEYRIIKEERLYRERLYEDGKPGNIETKVGYAYGIEQIQDPSVRIEPDLDVSLIQLLIDAHHLGESYKNGSF